MSMEVSQVMLKAINNGFEEKTLTSEFVCATPDSHAQELATEIALVLEENNNGPSFFNFMKFTNMIDNEIKSMMRNRFKHDYIRFIFFNK